MPLNEKEIKQNQQKMIRVAQAIKNKCDVHYIASDPTRLKIITLLKDHDKICVSDIAKILKISISAISHQLRLLERCNMVKSEKMGKTVCYSLTDKKIKL